MEQSEPAPTPATEVAIVGFGPVGAAIANLLGRYGIETVVIDKSPDIFMAPRAIALDNEALRILQWVGLDETAFARIAIPVVRMRSPLLGEFGRVNTLGCIDGHPKLVTFHQPDLEAALRRALECHGHVRSMPGTELLGFTQDADGVVLQLRRGDGAPFTLRSRYLVGADGAASLVRRLIGERFDGATYAEDWLIVDAKHVPAPIDHVEFLCDHRRPTPHMVAPGGRERWEFMLARGESRQDFETDARIAELIRPWTGGRPVEIERRAVYRFHARAAKAFRRGHVFLAGDAAHVTPPFVGQGLVAGLRDAANLAWKLAFVLRGHAGEAILDSYDQERRPHAAAMIAFARFMGRLVMPTSAARALIVHGIMRLTRLIPPLRRHFEDLGVKPRNRFAAGLFRRSHHRCRLACGEILPQGLVRDETGSLRLSDDALGAGLVLIGFGTDAVFGLEREQQAALAAAGGSVAQVCFRGQHLHRAASGTVLEDLTGTLIPGAAPEGWVALVRPDRTILHQGPAAEIGRILAEGLALLSAPGPGMAEARKIAG
ncbi:bifunctional 3-(3-hydroxy-phenyl)propionate/3-hydroxycinnamic acid hydroxylase [Zavarzinia compransoris]|uniref:3-(3-hydroxyphenyl)propionate hydroxylase n=1 Tax=Zavarzinia compransoris TaxID=1264899 RepID=A0A317DWG6_9PROT|nr:bifunctional 3-(3-hydroxy-phenyl)propionate/3-hydroxycinnamic acid hydroxylase [Zavarzinia compransoris]PWR18300.1 3-(3-hydroxyphenyl)propionate hydroxylase [Zavarzinia compransoris]TDP43643.1 3-(3-hydroxy-phenyl)propionate hydroxylase [Zavarzinia compransoris]